MGAVVISRQKATRARTCHNLHAIPSGTFYCHVDLAPGRPRRGGDWGYVESYCETCGTEKYARYRSILADIAKQEAIRTAKEAAASAHMEAMDTEQGKTFDIGYHRWVAHQIETGRATAAMVEGSHEHLLAEVERLTYLVSPAKLHLPASTEPVEVTTLLGLIDVLAKQRRNADIQVEYMGMKSSPGYMGSYRGMYDQLAIDPDGREPQTVADVLKTLRTIKRKGIQGEGGPYEVQSHTGVWVDRGQANHQHVSGVRVDGGVVVIMTEPREW